MLDGVEECEVASCQMLCLENNLPMFSTECSSHHQGKVKEMRTDVIYSHALLRIHVIGGQMSVRIASPCLLITVVQQTWTSSPPSRMKHFFMGIIYMCRAFFTNSSYPLPFSCTEELLVKEALHIQIISMEERFNREGELESLVAGLL